MRTTIDEALMEAVDDRVRAILAAERPRRGYGVVATVDGTSRTVGVYLSGEDVDVSEGFTYPSWAVPSVGDLVRVAFTADGDRYVEEIYPADPIGVGGPRWNSQTIARLFDTDPIGSYPMGESYFKGDGAHGFPITFGHVRTLKVGTGYAVQWNYNHRADTSDSYQRQWNTVNDAGWGPWQRMLAYDSSVASPSLVTATAYTPTVANAGTAAWAQQRGWYYRIGKLVFVRIYLAASAAGSGTTAVTITTPTSPQRNGGVARQVLSGSGSGVTPAGPLSMVAFAGGAGAVWDNVRMADDSILQGVDIASNALITIQGWYEEA